MKSSLRIPASGPLAAFIALLAACLAPAGVADEIHYDVFVTSAGGTKLVIGGFDDFNLTALVPADQLRVFGGEVVAKPGISYYEAGGEGEPGFRAGTQSFLDKNTLMTPAGVYTALPGTRNLTFNFQPITIGAATRNLFFWNGEGPVAFSPAAANVVLGLTKFAGTTPLWTASIDGSSSGVVAGNTIQETTSVGTVHTHLFASIGKAGAAPDQGFYLFSLQLEMTGLIASDPLYFVYGALDPTALSPVQLVEFQKAHEAALGWAEANVVPEPSTLALAALAAVATLPMIQVRRRQASR